MLDGKEKTTTKAPYFLVNKHGFVSLYALLILCIFLMFSLMFTQRVKALFVVHKMEDSLFHDIFIIRNIKNKLHSIEEEKEEAEEEEVDTEKDEEVEEQANVVEWEDTYQRTVIHFQLHNHKIEVSFPWDGYQKIIHILLDENDENIMSYEYEITG